MFRKISSTTLACSLCKRWRFSCFTGVWKAEEGGRHSLGGFGGAGPGCTEVPSVLGDHLPGRQEVASCGTSFLSGTFTFLKSYHFSLRNPALWIDVTVPLGISMVTQLQGTAWILDLSWCHLDGNKVTGAGVCSPM